MNHNHDKGFEKVHNHDKGFEKDLFQTYSPL